METYGRIQDHMDFIPRNVRPLWRPIPHRLVMCHFDRLAPNYPADPLVIRIITVSNERMLPSLQLSVKRVHTSVPLVIWSQNPVTAHVFGPLLLMALSYLQPSTHPPHHYP